MVPVNFYVALCAYVGTILLFVLGIWLWIEITAYRGSWGRFRTTQKKWRCHYCGYVYLGPGEENISQCPRCQSYNEV
ncbi:MAG: hypothetical protein C4532_17245 [Candidatus Abyssobacteria bacterium SURF_17]|jgi:uncharacterized paraquat-inducible protein A|uniref:Hydrogenase nickel incorporation protein HypA n=1 Tax=Candidatus Abyssobacteria bacterium SURF_17 TaxID=2093361 RepID=A0A419EQX5_9BACT|nr:MAG: hypothetical protein C4532_17245 [Candidatus Abyssubacteria bacterium SURF_17]